MLTAEKGKKTRHRQTQNAHTHTHARTHAHARTHTHKYIYTYIEKRKKKETILSSLQACFVITHSSGDFIVKNIRNHRLHTL